MKNNKNKDSIGQRILAQALKKGFKTEGVAHSQIIDGINWCAEQVRRGAR